MSMSYQHQIDDIRRPRVHLTYDVYDGGAIRQKEIPFVVGVLADLSGKPREKLPRLKDRKFVDIDRDSFNSVLERMKPRLAFQVANKLEKNDTMVGVELEFESLEDFRPEKVVTKVEPLRRLIEIRQKLSELAAEGDGNDKLGEELGRLAEELKAIVAQTDQQKQLGDEPREDS